MTKNFLIQKYLKVFICLKNEINIQKFRNQRKSYWIEILFCAICFWNNEKYQNKNLLNTNFWPYKLQNITVGGRKMTKMVNLLTSNQYTIKVNVLTFFFSILRLKYVMIFKLFLF